MQIAVSKYQYRAGGLEQQKHTNPSCERWMILELGDGVRWPENIAEHMRRNGRQNGTCGYSQDPIEEIVELITGSKIQKRSEPPE